jgi:pimeloyl-ACP methyl ester carboxylesterase
MTYAAEYPEEVAGMVLLDSMSPYAFTALPDFASEQSMIRRGLGVLPSLARLGVTQVLLASAWSSLSVPAASQAQAFASSPPGMRSMRDEQSIYPEVLDRAQALTSLNDKPLVVVTTTESLEQIKGWSDAQDRLAALSANSQRRVADATHEGLIDDQMMFQPSVTATSDVVQAIRAKRVGGVPMTLRAKSVRLRR